MADRTAPRKPAEDPNELLTAFLDAEQMAAEDTLVLDEAHLRLYEAVREMARQDVEEIEERIEAAAGRAEERIQELRQRRRGLTAIESSLETLLSALDDLAETGGEGGVPSGAAARPDWTFLAGGEPSSDTQLEALRYRLAWLEARAEELEAQRRSILNQSGLDGATGLLTGTAFWERVEEEFRRAFRTAVPLSVAAFTAAGWERLRARGDEHALTRALARAGRAARREVHRPGDAVGRGSAGLLILMPATARDGARQVAQRVQAALEKVSDGTGSAPELRCVGGTIWPRSGGSVRQLRDIVEGTAAAAHGSESVS